MKHRLFSSVLTFAIAVCAHAADWAPPSANQGWWTPHTATGVPGVGIPGGIEQYAAGGVNDRASVGIVIDVTQSPYNADNTGVADCRDALQAAINAVSGVTVIYFPAGVYRFATGGIGNGTGGSQKSNFTIRGAGVGLTTWNLELSGALFTWTQPGSIDTDAQTVTGTKTKGTTAITVSDASAYSAGMFVGLSFENEVDNARIQAGAAPVWSSSGYPFSRRMFARVTSVSAGTINIDPPLIADATNLELVIQRYALNWRSEGIGVEDMTVNFDSPDHTWAFNVSTAAYCWFYRVHFTGWELNTFNYSPIKLSEVYRCEIRKCRFDATDSGASSDGAIETISVTSCLIEDNIFTGDFDTHIYESGNSANNVISYNFSDRGTFTDFHNTHPSLNLVEGNAGYTHHSDGYHGSSSHNTIYRNWLRGGAGVILNRFKRNYVIAGNHLGDDGVTSGGISWGNPNMGNGDARGFAGPTGLSDQEGEIDYQQNDGTPNTYVIQAGDIFSGDFWDDWEITGTLTTRTSDTVATFTMNSGHWYTGTSVTSDSTLAPTIYWNSKANRTNRGTVTAVSGNLVTISFPDGSLPSEGTAVMAYMFNGGWQERDLDVQASSTLVENYWSSSGGTGSLQDGTAETLPVSLAYSAKPAWFGTIEWAAFDPNNAATQSVVRIPAGYRYVNGNEDYLGGTAPIAPSGLTATSAGSSQINLTWSDNSDNESGFRIERRVGVGSWGTVTSVSAGSTSYSNTGLSPSTTYEYRVYAYNGAGDSTASNTDDATTDAGGGGEAGNANININGNLIIQKLIIQ